LDGTVSEGNRIRGTRTIRTRDDPDQRGDVAGSSGSPVSTTRGSDWCGKRTIFLAMPSLEFPRSPLRLSGPPLRKTSTSGDALNRRFGLNLPSRTKLPRIPVSRACAAAYAAGEYTEALKRIKPVIQSYPNIAATYLSAGLFTGN